MNRSTRKKCSRGKSCGASCVQRSRSCKLLLSPQVSKSLAIVSQKLGVVGLYNRVKEQRVPGNIVMFERIRKNLREEIGKQIRSPEDVKELKKRLEEAGLLPRENKDISLRTPKETSSSLREIKESSRSEWDRLNSKEYDAKIEKETLTRKGYKKWNSWTDDNSSLAGRGECGFVERNPDGLYIKRGIISEQEPDILQTLGKRGLGPSLIAADLDGKVSSEYKGSRDEFIEASQHFGLRHGRMAMTPVQGKSLESFSGLPEEKIGNEIAADIYWKAMANMHRLGVAHNDAHGGNVFIDEKSAKGRWVDFGVSQKSAKAALAEALGSFLDEDTFNPKRVRKYMSEDSNYASGLGDPGNWQSRSWPVSGLSELPRIGSSEREMSRFKEEYPILGLIVNNLDKVNEKLRKKGLNEDQIVAMYAHGIRSPLESYKQGPWSRITDKEAEGLIDTLYKGVPSTLE